MGRIIGYNMWIQIWYLQLCTALLVVVVRNILKLRPVYLSCLQALQDYFYDFGPNYSNVVRRKPRD